jgi:betaine reductase
MTREIERVAGIPVAQIATIVPIMLTVGTNRIIPGVAIPHPAGDPQLGHEGDLEVRREIVARALQALSTEIEEQTIFEKEL